jgi:hypothetical protein
VLRHLKKKSQEKSQKIKIKSSFNLLLNGPVLAQISRFKASKKKKKKKTRRNKKKFWLSSFIFIALWEELY